jgi:hypothetical protein
MHSKAANVPCIDCDGEGRAYTQDGWDDEGKPYYVTHKCDVCDGLGFVDTIEQAWGAKVDNDYDTWSED